MESWSHGATSVTTFCTFANTMYLQLWDLLEGKKLFNAVNRDGTDEHDDQVHLAHITALLGSLPMELTRGRRSSIFYGADGAHAFRILRCILTSSRTT